MSTNPHKTKTKGTAITSVESEFAALAPAAAGRSVAEIIRQNVGPGGITPADLERIKVPAGGGLAWTLPDGEPIKEIEAVILAHGYRRSYWREKYSGANVPPDCWSKDAEIGEGCYGRKSPENPSGACITCRMAQFGTAVDEKGQAGKGQACQLRHVLLMLRPGSLLPVVLATPPSSLKQVKGYLLRLAGAGIVFNELTTKFTLTATRSATGITYSQIAPTMGRRLEPSELTGIEAYMRQVLPAFEQVGVEPEESTDQE